MQDLDIRGAGNLLGSEQSGFISDLGYETYQKILNQAMAELRNEMPQDDKDSGIQGVKDNSPADSGNVLNAISFVDDCALESDIEMYFPDQYVPSDSERMLLYRELDNLAGSSRLESDLEAYRKRLVDRFGAIPPVAEELIEVVPGVDGAVNVLNGLYVGRQRTRESIGTFQKDGNHMLVQPQSMSFVIRPSFTSCGALYCVAV